MFKNKIFVKMVVIYFCIVLSTLTMLGVLLSFLLNNYLIYNKQTEMQVKTSDISNLVRPFLLEKRDPGELIELLNRADKNLGTEVWVIDRKGAVIAASADQRIHEGDLVEPSDITEMQQGKTVTRQGKSSLYQETVLWVMVPVEADNKVVGGIIMYSPIMGITQTMLKVRNLFLYSAFVSIIFSAIVVHFFAKYVTSPLGAMNRVAKQLAGGNFTERVKIKQNDEIGNLGEAFNYMADQIEKQEKMRREFVADVSHELKSPLTNIRGFIEAMMDGKDRTAEDRARYLGILHKETMRLIRLVNELLDLSRLESGSVIIAEAPVRITDVIENSIIKLLKPTLEETAVNVSLDAPDREIRVLGNRDRLEQVITNLLDNANRHSLPGGRVLVKVIENKGFVEVSVRDEGEGIPAEELPLVWERFYKVDKARCREGGGTGLGLAIVRQIIEALGGRVWAESEPGKGAEIGFALPVYKNS